MERNIIDTISVDFHMRKDMGGSNGITSFVYYCVTCPQDPDQNQESSKTIRLQSSEWNLQRDAIFYFLDRYRSIHFH